MPQNEDIVIANLAPDGPPEIADALESIEQEAPAFVPTEKTATPQGPMAVPGYAERDDGNFGAQDDESDFFLKDLPKKPESADAGTSSADEGVDEPARDVSPPPAAPSPPAPDGAPELDPRLLQIAESFGLSSEEAQSYGNNDNLLRTLQIIARNLPGVDEAQAQTTTPQSGVPNKTPEPPKPEPEIELPDPAELEKAGFDPVLVNMAKSMKAMHDRYKTKLEGVDKLHAEMTKDLAERRAEQRQRAVEETFKEAGFDAKQFKPQDLQKIVSRVSALYQVYTQEGSVPPTSELIKLAVPLVVKDAKTNGTEKPEVQEALAAKRRAASSALAKKMGRSAIGRFTGPADPTHRRGGEQVNGGSLRQFMADRGIDPREATSSDERGGFLPG